MGKWVETMMTDHKEADTISEESIRNIKTVASLSAESNIVSKYKSIVELLNLIDKRNKQCRLLK